MLIYYEPSYQKNKLYAQLELMKLIQRAQNIYTSASAIIRSVQRSDKLGNVTKDQPTKVSIWSIH